jgi:hypothetical protein
VAIGYLRSSNDRLEMDPDRRIREALNLVFRKFNEVARSRFGQSKALRKADAVQRLRRRRDKLSMRDRGNIDARQGPGGNAGSIEGGLSATGNGLSDVQRRPGHPEAVSPR